MRKIDVPAGTTFGRLTVLREVVSTRAEGGRKMLCRCDCGAETTALLSNLRHCKTTGCGLRCTLHPLKKPGRRTENGGRTLTYQTWDCMWQRCVNPKSAGWQHYGGRGITVCERWRSFDAFRADMGERPSPDHSIHRLTPDSNYEPGSCVWATRREQARCTRRNVMVAVDGIVACIAEWAERVELKAATIHSRLKRGWPPELAVGLAPLSPRQRLAHLVAA